MANDAELKASYLRSQAQLRGLFTSVTDVHGYSTKVLIGCKLKKTPL